MVEALMKSETPLSGILVSVLQLYFPKALNISVIFGRFSDLLPFGLPSRFVNRKQWLCEYFQRF